MDLPYRLKIKWKAKDVVRSVKKFFKKRSARKRIEEYHKRVERVMANEDEAPFVKILYSVPPLTGAEKDSWIYGVELPEKHQELKEEILNYANTELVDYFDSVAFGIFERDWIEHEIQKGFKGCIYSLENLTENLPRRVRLMDKKIDDLVNILYKIPEL